MGPWWIRPHVIFLKRFDDLSLRILVVIFLHVLILQRRHLLRSIFGGFLLLLGLLNFLNIQSINALETSEITKFFTSTTGFLQLLHFFLAIEDGVLVIRVHIIGQVGMLLDANLFFGIIVDVLAESTLGFDSFRGRVVGRSELTCSRVPRLSSILNDLFV